MLSAGITAFLVALAGLPLVIAGLRRLSIVDVPNHRSSHSLPTPRGGGMGVVLAVVTAIALAAAANRAIVDWPIWALLICWICAAALGFTDDVKGLSPQSRLLTQTAIAVTTAIALPWQGKASGLTGIVLIGAIGFSLLAFTNVFNFMDGINGISGIHAAIAAGYYAWLAQMSHQAALAVVAATICGACLGYLPWNFPSPRVFLGDSGSYFLGMAICSLGGMLWLQGIPLRASVAPLVVYLADVVFTLGRRARVGAKLTEAHRDHTYQRLAARWGHVRSAIIVSAATAATVALAYGLRAVNVVTACLLMLLPAAGYLALPRLTRTFGLRGERMHG